MSVRTIARALGLGRVHAWAVRVPASGRRRSQPFYRWLHRVALRGRGYGPSDWMGSGESELLRRLGQQRPDVRVVFDVGANVGGWANVAAQTWPSATIYAFEPASATYAALVHNVKDLRVVPVNAALSSERGKATLHAVPGQSGLSSLHQRDLVDFGMAMTQTEPVEMMRLDEYAAEHGVSHIDLLKVDAEGHELSVLEGASGLIERGAIDVIQFEFGGTSIDSRTFLRDFVRYLSPRYRLSRILSDGLEPLDYSEREEIFVTCNFLAERAD